MRNPTNCASLTTESSVTGYVPGSSESATASAKSPFQVANCSALAFKPSFTATSSAKVSKANGTSLETTLKMPSKNSNVKSVLVQLPKQLVSRLTTLNKACLAAAFENNPFGCPPGSFVGGVTAKTPLLPGTLTGPAVLVSHGGEAFPDLDLILDGPNGAARDPRRPHQNHQRHHDDQLLRNAGRAGRIGRGEPAGRVALGGHEQRKPVRPAAGDAHHHHRLERRLLQTEHEHQGQGLRRAHHRPEDRPATPPT